MTTEGAATGKPVPCIFFFLRKDIKKARIPRLLLWVFCCRRRSTLRRRAALRFALAALRRTRPRPYRRTWWSVQAPLNGRRRCVRTGFGPLTLRPGRRNQRRRTRTRGGAFTLDLLERLRDRCPGEPPGRGVAG